MRGAVVFRECMGGLQRRTIDLAFETAGFVAVAGAVAHTVILGLRDAAFASAGVLVAVALRRVLGRRGRRCAGR